MGEKRLNFNKPLLSVRRFHSSISSSATTTAEKVEKNVVTEPNVSVKKGSLPFYKSDLKSGPVRNPGVVPFVWEQVPGLPKEDSSNSGDLTSTNFTVADRHLEVPKLPPGPRSDVVSAMVSSASERLDGDRSKVLKEKESSEKPIAVEDPVSDYRGSAANFDDEEDSFSDAVETLSRTESCSMNCSVVSGMTGIINLTASAASGPSGSFFSTDPQVRDFMMGRFLLAAQAMVTESPKVNLRKPNCSALEPTRRVQNGASRRPVPLPYQNRPKTISRFPDSGQIESVNSDDDEDDDEYYDDTRHMAMKGCGFLLPKFCLRSSFGVMNPVTGVRAKTRPAALPNRQRYHPEIKTSADQGRPVVYRKTWKSVFRHKLGDGVQKGEDGSKQTTESYPITYWSNSQSRNGSSSFRRSTDGGASPGRNDLSQSSFGEGKGLLRVPTGDQKIGKIDSFKSPRKGINRNSLDSKPWTGSASPVIEKTLYVDSACMPEIPNSKSSFVNSNGNLSPTGRDCEVATESGIMEEKSVLQASEDEKLQNEITEVLRTDTCDTEGSNHREEARNLDESREDAIMDISIIEQLADQGKDSEVAFQSLFPPPLPTSPSESWLRRTLPSVSSKKPTTQTFLGKQFNSKKKTVQIPSVDPFLKNIMQSGLLRFSEVLAKPLNEEC